MAREKITKRSVDALESGTTIFDTELKGFMVRARGQSKVFAVKYSVDRRQRIYTIGRFGDLKVEEARSKAMDVLSKVSKAKMDEEVLDPQSEREIQRQAPKNSVSGICAEFIERHAKKNRTWKETEWILEHYVLSKWRNRDIRKIKRVEINQLLDGIEDKSGRVMATAVLAQVRKMFNWHAARDDRFISPIVPGMARVKPSDIRRDRVLTDLEIRFVWTALDGLKSPYRELVRVLLLTAQRREEVAGMLRDEVDLDKATWTIPANRYKTKVAHTVPLSPAAVAILSKLPKNGPFFFTTNGESPFSGFAKDKRRLDKAVEAQREAYANGLPEDQPVPLVAPWRIHDLRRTAKTLMVRAGVRPDISERVLGHKIPGVEGTYDRHSYVEERKLAVESLWKQVVRCLHSSSS